MFLKFIIELDKLIRGIWDLINKFANEMWGPYWIFYLAVLVAFIIYRQYSEFKKTGEEQTYQKCIKYLKSKLIL